MSRKYRRLVDWVSALKGAVQWHMETGDASLPVPDGYRVPRFDGLETQTDSQIPGESAPPRAHAKSGDAAGMFESAFESDSNKSDDKRAIGRPKHTFSQPEKPCWQLIPIDINVEGSEMGQRAASLQALRDQVTDGTLCSAECNHTEYVFGQGHPGAKLLFIADAPGPREDELGLPFVDESGRLLARMIRAMGLKRNDVYLTYLVKCYCPNKSVEEQLDDWAGVVATEIQIVKPDVIIALGELTARRLTGRKDAFPHLRGKWFDYEGIPILPTFHPEALLQFPQSKSLVWTDLKAVMRNLGLSAQGPGTQKK
ncbi:MAG: uracil-DNA glycosylase [Myxococcota bacterium]|nr:uracil-DNA glycosylase [Myxococcota bacterium]